MYFVYKKKNVVTLPHSVHRKMHLSLKQKKTISQRKWHLGRKLLWNYYTKDWDTGLPDNLWLDILQIFGRIYNLGYIQTPFAHHDIYLQLIKGLGPRLH